MDGSQLSVPSTSSHWLGPLGAGVTLGSIEEDAARRLGGLRSPNLQRWVARGNNHVGNLSVVFTSQ
jgi:hypothetical protein